MEINGEVLAEFVMVGTTVVRPEDMTAEQQRRWLVLTEAARAEYARTRNIEELP